jgi:alcohol dehydrogenase (cytochrome c)
VCNNVGLSSDRKAHAVAQPQPASRPDSDGKFGLLEAINLATGEVARTHRQRAPLVSSLLVTLRGLTFAASLDGSFTAYDVSTGRNLWQTELHAVGNASPVTYSVRGEQYVAIVAGSGGPLSAGSGLTREIISPPACITLRVFKLPSR